MARLLAVSRAVLRLAGRDPSHQALRAKPIGAKIDWFRGGSDEVSGARQILDLREDREIISCKIVITTTRQPCLRVDSVA